MISPAVPSSGPPANPLITSIQLLVIMRQSAATRLNTSLLVGVRRERYLLKGKAQRKQIYIHTYV